MERCYLRMSKESRTCDFAGFPALSDCKLLRKLRLIRMKTGKMNMQQDTQRTNQRSWSFLFLPAAALLWLLSRPLVVLQGLGLAASLGWLLLWSLGVLCGARWLHVRWQLQRQSLQQAMDRVAHGDLSQNSGDQAVGAGMVQALSGMVADVRSNAALVAQAGQSMVNEHQALAQRTEAQASNLAQTVISVEQLTTACKTMWKWRAPRIRRPMACAPPLIRGRSYAARRALGGVH